MEQLRLHQVADRFFELDFLRREEENQARQKRKREHPHLTRQACELADTFMPVGLLRAVTPANSRGKRVFDVQSIYPDRGTITLTSPEGDPLGLVKGDDNGAVTVIFGNKTHFCTPMAKAPSGTYEDRILEKVLLGYMLPHFQGTMRGHLCLALAAFEKPEMHRRKGSTGTAYYSTQPAVFLPR